MIKQAAFDKVRASILAKAATLEGIRTTLDLKYGPGRQSHWLSAGERSRLERASAAYDKACDRMFTLLDASPRDWRQGVPAHWTCERLSYTDAVRPLAEPLAVEPPRAYGY